MKQLLSHVSQKINSVDQVLLIDGMLLKASNASNKVLCTFAAYNGNYQQVVKAYTIRSSGTSDHCKTCYISLTIWSTVTEGYTAQKVTFPKC